MRSPMIFGKRFSVFKGGTVKKSIIIFGFILCLIGMAGVAYATDATTTASEANRWTPTLSPATSTGFLNISISGTFEAAVTLQRSFDGGSSWRDVETWTVPSEAQLYDYESGVIYRLGIDAGDYVSGAALLRLSR